MLRLDPIVLNTASILITIGFIDKLKARSNPEFVNGSLYLFLLSLINSLSSALVLAERGDEQSDKGAWILLSRIMGIVAWITFSIGIILLITQLT